jgi:hypothetical protein
MGVESISASFMRQAEISTQRKPSHRHNMQMSMPKPVCPNMATATALGPPGAETAQQHAAGLLKLDAQPSAARIHLPEGAARKVSASVRRACIPGHLRGVGPEPGTWKEPDPRRRSSRGSGGSE